MSVTECYQHKIVNKVNPNSFSLSLASALHQRANSTTLIVSALVLKLSAFLVLFFIALTITITWAKVSATALNLLDLVLVKIS